MNKKDIKKIAREYIFNELRIVYRYYVMHTNESKVINNQDSPKSEHWIS